MKEMNFMNTMTMTPRHRFLAAMRAGGVPDRVPCTPDISNYIPCKRTGLPFWDIYFKNELPLWKAYLNAADNPHPDTGSEKAKRLLADWHLID